MKALLAGVLFSGLVVPAPPQAPVLPRFVTIAEGLTSPNRTTGISAAYRMFTLSTLAKACGESERPLKLVSLAQDITLQVGQWFRYSRLIIVAEDRKGRVLRPLPIALEAEVINPPALNTNADMIADSRVMPIRAGKFRFRARTICKGSSADVFVQGVVKPN